MYKTENLCGVSGMPTERSEGGLILCTFSDRRGGAARVREFGFRVSVVACPPAVQCEVAADAVRVSTSYKETQASRTVKSRAKLSLGN